MKKIVVFLVLCGLFAFGFTDDNLYNVKNIEESITFSEPEIIITNQYITLKLKEAEATLSKTGEPVLPVLTKTFILPFGTKIEDLEVSFSEGRMINLSKKIQPGPEPRSKIDLRAPREPRKKNEIYESDGLYPSKKFTCSAGAGIKDKKRVIFLKVCIYPLRYSPGKDIVYFCENVNIKVTYQEPEVPITFPDENDMVIIAPGIFTDELQSLITHKNSRGVQTVLKTTEDIYTEYPGRDQPEKIKYFIKDAIETWGVSYVLLVGGAAQVPGRYTHIYFDYDYQDYWIFLSDLYYADVYDSALGFSSWDSDDDSIFGEYNWYGDTDEVDLYPDVYLGRLACVNESQVTVCVNKIIAYETSNVYAQDWFTRLVLIGGDSLPGDTEQVDEGEYVNQCVADTMDGFIPDKVWASNGRLYDADNISAAIDSGASFVFFNGHGHQTIWATHPHESYIWIPPGNYTNSHIYALTNSGRLPIVVSDACYHCQYDAASNCFGWAFVNHPSGGCIAYLGGTDIDVSYGGVFIITKGIERLCVLMTSNYQQGDKTFGELWVNGITDYLSPVMDEIDYITVEESQPFGDPSLQIAGSSQKPYQPEPPQGDTQGTAGLEYTYTASTTDPDGDSLFYLFDWDDETYSGWSGPYDSGDTAQESHLWADSATYEVKVIVRDVNGVFSSYSDPLVVKVSFLCGDVTSDSEINLSDPICLANYYFGKPCFINPLASDVNCDSLVNLGDAIIIGKYYFGIPGFELNCGL